MRGCLAACFLAVLALLSSTTAVNASANTPLTASLPNMVVYATPSASTVAQISSRAIVLDRKIIEESPARSIMELLQGVEGLFIPQANTEQPLFPTLTMRGLGSGNLGVNTPVLFLLNGHNISGTFNVVNAFADISAIPLPLVKRVEIIKGPYSSVYGSGALAGVINVVTYKKVRSSPSGEVQFTLGSDSYKTVTGTLGFHASDYHVLGWVNQDDGPERKYFPDSMKPFWGYLGRGFNEQFKVGASVGSPGTELEFAL